MSAEPYVHLTFKINLPKADMTSRETAIASAMRAMETEVPRFIDWLMTTSRDD